MLLHWAVSYRTVSNLEKTILDGQGWKRGAGDDSWLERVGIYITFLIVLKMNEEMKEGEDISRLTAGQVARIGRQQSLQLKLSTNPVTVGLKMVRREHCYI